MTNQPSTVFIPFMSRPNTSSFLRPDPAYYTSGEIPYWRNGVGDSYSGGSYSPPGSKTLVINTGDPEMPSFNSHSYDDFVQGYIQLKTDIPIGPQRPTSSLVPANQARNGIQILMPVDTAVPSRPLPALGLPAIDRPTIVVPAPAPVPAPTPALVPAQAVPEAPKKVPPIVEEADPVEEDEDFDMDAYRWCAIIFGVLFALAALALIALLLAFFLRLVAYIQQLYPGHKVVSIQRLYPGSSSSSQQCP